MQLPPRAADHFEDTHVAIEQQQSGQAAPTTDAAPVATAPAFAGAARRRFAKSGATVAVGALTLKSLPGMACTNPRAPSGMASSGLNSHKPGTVVDSGRNCDWWNSSQSTWDSTCKRTSNFRATFTCGQSSVFYNKKCSDIIAGPQSYDTQGVARLCLAAYQNACTGKTSFLTKNQVQSIWNEYQTTGGGASGYYKPNSRTKWYAADIATYLAGTMDN